MGDVTAGPWGRPGTACLLDLSVGSATAARRRAAEGGPVDVAAAAAAILEEIREARAEVRRGGE